MTVEVRPDRSERVAIVLFNLGGPDRPESIRPFLMNLFRDPAILRVPFFVRPLLAWIIARARVAPATANYAILGGRSPLLGLTRRQADALQDEIAALSGFGGPSVVCRCFIAMRYWHPFADEAIDEVRRFDPDRVLLLPLYPQFSTTTTGSSLSDWRGRAAARGLAVATTSLCCWHSDPAFVAAFADLAARAIEEARRLAPPGVKLRVLFSAHGLPEVIVRRGDPYQFQVERSAAAVARALGSPRMSDVRDIDWLVCFQSRATPQQWLQPSTDEEIERAGREGVGLVVVPIAFVSDHSETLVELDVEYRELAEKAGVPVYVRAAVPNDDRSFIRALAGIALKAVRQGDGLCSFRGGRICPGRFGDCPHAQRTEEVATRAVEAIA